MARPERPQEPRGRSRPLLWGPSWCWCPLDMEALGVGGLVPGLGPELLAHEVELCLAQEQLLLEDRRRQAQLHMRLWQEEQLWLQQLQEQQAWVRVEGLEPQPWPWSSSAARALRGAADPRPGKAWRGNWGGGG